MFLFLRELVKTVEEGPGEYRPFSHFRRMIRAPFASLSIFSSFFPSFRLLLSCHLDSEKHPLFKKSYRQIPWEMECHFKVTIRIRGPKAFLLFHQDILSRFEGRNGTCFFFSSATFRGHMVMVFFHQVIVREIGWLFFEGDHACVRSILLVFSFCHHCVSKKRDEAALVEH